MATTLEGKFSCFWKQILAGERGGATREEELGAEFIWVEWNRRESHHHMTIATNGMACSEEEREREKQKHEEQVFHSPLFHRGTVPPHAVILNRGLLCPHLPKLPPC